MNAACSPGTWAVGGSIIPQSRWFKKKDWPSMYVPPAFSEKRLDVLHEFMRRHAFATVVTNGPDGPIASHVPVLLLARRGLYCALQMHLARQNEQWRVLAGGEGALVM